MIWEDMDEAEPAAIYTRPEWLTAVAVLVAFVGLLLVVFTGDVWQRIGAVSIVLSVAMLVATKPRG